MDVGAGIHNILFGLFFSCQVNNDYWLNQVDCFGVRGETYQMSVEYFEECIKSNIGGEN